MILYFADRQLNIMGQASTSLPHGLVVIDDLKTEDVETGVAVFECSLPYDASTRATVANCAKVGNYILRSHKNANEFYTIIEVETDTKNQEVRIYAEDAGLDLLNEVVGEYEADKAYTMAYYINKFAGNSGFVIGTNEAADLTRKLSWDGEATATDRIASVATQFGCEVSYSFDIKGLSVTKKYINIHKQRGKDIGAQLRLNYELDRIVTTESIENLATALQCKGAIPDEKNAVDPITLAGYTYDDGDFYVSGGILYSRNALKNWERVLSGNGHIVRQFEYDTANKATLCTHAIAELKKIREVAVNYEVDAKKLPDNIKIGDRINIVDDAGELYLSARVLKLTESVCDEEHEATLGEYLLKGSGISQKVIDLAKKFAEYSVSAARALKIANTAKEEAVAAQAQADAAAKGASEAQKAAGDAAQAANTATQSAAEAQAKADAAVGAVDAVEKSVEELNTTVENAQKAADDAQQAANTAQSKADEAAQAAAQAKADAADASAAVEEAAGAAQTAVTKADEAIATAGSAKTQADTAKATADAAKLDAEKAQEDIDSLGERLTTVSNTMAADYARKTDLTETEASLQSQISQNAAQIQTAVSRVQTIDETANNAQEQAAAAQTKADEAKATANQATADAQAAQAAADTAAAAATSAQSEADKAKAAAEAAQGVADKAESDLEKAKADLATVSGRVDATEEEIAAAQQAVNAAQQAADKANEDATAAAQKADTAQSVANTAASDASKAQTAANEAKTAAALAQQTADAAKGDASAAIAKAEEAKATAATAQSTANTAKTNAEAAQTKANQAAADAAAAQKAADDADAKAAQAATDLATAQQNLANVTSRVDATAEEVAAAQAAVEAAQAAADKAKTDAAAAQSTADTAKTNAANAQAKADQAKTAADNAQKAADDAQQAADDAQAAVDALAVRVTTAETKITQNAEEIALRAKKTEVTETLGGYYTKTEADAAITTSAENIRLEVVEVEETASNADSKAGDLDTRMKTAEASINLLKDAISMLVVGDGSASLLEQTGSGWSFNLTGTQDSIAAVQDGLNNLAGDVGDTSKTLSDFMDNTNDQLGKYNSHITIGTYTDPVNGDEEPCIKFHQDDTDYTVIITNERVLFQEGGAVPVDISKGTLNAENINIKGKGKLKHGQFAWVDHSDSTIQRLGLVWEGA